jgi:ribosomal protein L17
VLSPSSRFRDESPYEAFACSLPSRFRSFAFSRSQSGSLSETQRGALARNREQQIVEAERRPDAELVARAREGDKRAFDRLVTRYEATARRVAWSMVADEEVVRDLVQEAMLQAYLYIAIS